VLRLEPGREEDAQYWLASLSVNRAIMRALDASESDCAPRRHEDASNRRRTDCDPQRQTRIA
jgi:hypothetical protein